MDRTIEMEFKSQFKAWNEEHKALRLLLHDPGQFEKAVTLFLNHHAVLHLKRMAGIESWSFADVVLDGLSEEQLRQIPVKEEHSIAWLLWHMARIEDVAVNTLVAGSRQVFNEEGWGDRLQAGIHNTGNAMGMREVEEFSTAINIDALREYRVAVGRRTREIVQTLQPEDLTRKVVPLRLQQVLDQGDLVEAASGIADYWGKRTTIGLLLMPATRHNMVHLNEAFRLRKKQG